MTDDRQRRNRNTFSRNLLHKIKIGAVYSFRVPFDVLGNRPDTSDSELQLWSVGRERIWLGSNGPLEAARRVYLRGSGFASADAAEERASHLLAVLRLAFLRTGIRADFLHRRSFGQFSPEALAIMREHLPADVMVVNETAGILVHQTDQEVVAPSMSATGRALTPPDQLLTHFATAMVETVPNDRAILAFDIFCGASSMPTRESTVVVLVSAIEALVVRGSVDPEEIHLIEALVGYVQRSRLDPDKQRALASRVESLKEESVRRAALRLVRRLDDRTYGDMTPKRFFDRIYAIRSALAHGDYTPTISDVDLVLSNLRTFVRDLIELAFIEGVE